MRCTYILYNTSFCFSTSSSLSLSSRSTKNLQQKQKMNPSRNRRIYHRHTWRFLDMRGTQSRLHGHGVSSTRAGIHTPCYCYPVTQPTGQEKGLRGGSVVSPTCQCIGVQVGMSVIKAWVRRNCTPLRGFFTDIPFVPCTWHRVRV